jgi:uncharacterized protein DUF3237
MKKLSIILTLVCGLAGGLLIAQNPAPGTKERPLSNKMAPIAPGLVLAFEAHVQVGPPMDIGAVQGGQRRIVPILGGSFEGSGMRGRVLPGGADWQIVRADGVLELDTRYTLETDQGKLIYVQNPGIRHAPPEIMAKLAAGQPVDPSLVYFRTVPKFETSAPELAWLTRSIFVGTGERFPTEVLIRFWKLE